MNVSPQDLVAIGAVVSAMVQLGKKALPGDWNEWGVEITGLFSALAVAAWVASQPGTLDRSAFFDLLTLWIGVFTTATGAYKIAKMVTNGVRQDDEDPADEVPPRILKQVRRLRPDEREAA
jgi:hypothetical protein